MTALTPQEIKRRVEKETGKPYDPWWHNHLKPWENRDQALLAAKLVSGAKNDSI